MAYAAYQFKVNEFTIHRNTIHAFYKCRGTIRNHDQREPS